MSKTTLKFLKGIKPDYEKPESYQHGFHDAVEVVENHITLHKVEEKMYSRKQVIEFAKYYNGTVNSIAYQDKTSDLYRNTTEELFEKFFEQNIK